MKKPVMPGLLGIILVVLIVLNTGSGTDRLVFAEAQPYEALEHFTEGYKLYPADPLYKDEFLNSQKIILNRQKLRTEKKKQF